MEQRLFKRVSVIGLDFYVDYLDNGQIICIKEVHSGRRFIPDNLYLGNKPVLEVFNEAIGVDKLAKPAESVVEPVAEVKKEVKPNAKKAGKRASK